MKKWFARIKDFLINSVDQHIAAFAGQSVFFIFLSFFPLLNILFSLMPLFSFTEQQLEDMLVRVFPKDLSGYIRDVISEIYSNGTPTVTFISIVVALWAAAKGVMAIRNGLNEIYHSRETRNYLVIRGISAIYTLVFILVLVVLTMANLFGRQIYYSFLEKHEEIRDLSGLLVHLRGVGSFLLIFLMLWGMYTLMPNRKLQFRYQAPGALFASGAWSLVSWGFSYYIEFAMSQSYMYGSLTAIVTVLIWMYVIINIIFFGAMLNEFLYLYVYRERVERRAERKRKIKAMKKNARSERKEERREIRAAKQGGLSDKAVSELPGFEEPDLEEPDDPLDPNEPDAPPDPEEPDDLLDPDGSDDPPEVDPEEASGEENGEDMRREEERVK